ncbi:MAG: hypothetical protein ACO1RX_12585 [Candidatus Sericytochromatia bacterium]
MAESGFNPEFQEQLIQEYLLEQGKIRPEQLSQALTRLRQYKLGQQGEQQASSYVFDQRSYSLQERDPWTGKVRRELPLPTNRKYKPRYLSIDWVPTGSGSVYLFHASNAREIGEIVWENDEGGLTVSERYTHLYFGELDEHPYLALDDQLHWGQIPMQTLNCLPVDMVMSPNRQQLFLSDRGRGTIFIVDLQEFKLLGSLIVRPPGSRKTLNLAPSPDGQRLFITDQTTPALLIVNLRTLKIRRQPLPYGILGNVRLSPDGQWLYLQSTRPDESVEIVVLDTNNLLNRATIPLHGNLFSGLDDPLDLMAVSPTSPWLLFMTYVNTPAMFTPWINFVDLESYQLVDRYALITDDSKPSHLAFAVAKPDGYFKVDLSILDVLMEMGHISLQDVEDAEWKIHDTLPRHKARVEEPGLQLADFGSDNDLQGVFTYEDNELREIDAVEEKRGNPEDDYPVLNEHQIDPSILIQFREALLRQYEFVPINQLNGIFRIAAVQPSRPEIELIAKKLFPDLPLFVIPFEKGEFDRFMREFYTTIMTRMKNIVSRMNPEQRSEFVESAPPGVIENLQLHASAAYAPPAPAAPEPPKAERPQLPEGYAIPVPPEKPKPILPPEPEGLAPEPQADDGGVAEVVGPASKAMTTALPEAESETPPDPKEGEPDWSLISTEALNQRLLAYCLNEFTKIWGIDVSQDTSVREKLLPLVERARRELMTFDYTIIRVADLFNQFSLETVITKETFLKIAHELVPVSARPVPEAAAPKLPVQQLADKVEQAVNAPSRLQFEADDEVLRSDDLPADTFLMSDVDRQRIIEFTNKGMITWQIGGFDGIGQVELIEPQNPIRLPNGNTLFADAGQDTVFEVSRSGQIRWQFPPADKSSDIRLHRPVKAMRKLNGNTIIVDQGNHRIIEINGQHKIVWQYGITASVGITRGRLYSPGDMQSLKGGHFLITDTDNHRVIEVNSDEEIVWQYGNPENKLGSGYGSHTQQLSSPIQAFRLPNGNTLIADSENRRVIEVSPDKEVVWAFDTGIEKASGGAFSFVPVRVIRMGSGNTIVFSPLYVIEVTRLLRPLYLYQYASLVKAPEYEQARAESEKIVPLSNKPTPEHINQLAKQAAQKYVVTQATLVDIEVPLIDKQENRVYLINRQKQIVWRVGEDNPRHPLHLERPQHVELSEREDSEVLITDTDNHRVLRMYRPTKEIIWQYGEKGVMGSRPGLLGHPRSAVTTPDNTVLITDQYSGRVLEIDVYGRLVWSFGGWDNGANPLNAPYYAEVTPDNTVLITDWSNHYVLEVNREGEIIWQYGMLKNPGVGPHQLMYPERAQRMLNGNTLIVASRNHRVIEVDPAGGIPWQFGGNVSDGAKKITNPTAAWRLSNGHTLIAHSGNRQLTEVTMHHQLVWHYLLPANRR